VFDGALVNGLATGKFKWKLKMGRSSKIWCRFRLKIVQNKVSIVADYFIDTRADLLIPFIPVSESMELPLLALVLQQSMQELSRNSGLEFAIDYKTNFR
jgi:hypothetical protein